MASWAPCTHPFVCPEEQNVKALKQNTILVLGSNGSGLLEVSAQAALAKPHTKDLFLWPRPAALPSHNHLLWYLQALQKPSLPSCL